MAQTDTAEFAHVRLPAVGWAEKDGTVTNSERVISRQRAFLPPAGEARPDWCIIAQVATRLGWGDAFAWSSPAAIFREHAALTGLGNNGRRAFDISGLASITDAEFAAMPPTRWPCPAKGKAAERFFAAGKFTAGRARFVPTPWCGKDAVASGDDGALTLLTGRYRDQWHTMTRTGGVPRLMAHAPEPVLSVHPEDARGTADGALARIAGTHGEAVLRLRHDTGQRRGTAFAPMHWTARNAPSARVNSAVPLAADPVSGQPALKSARVALSAYEPAWHAFLLARRDLGPDLAPYCATGLAAHGVWRHELAGTEEPRQAFARLLALVDERSSAAWARLDDAASGLHRGVLLEGGRPAAALFLGPHHRLPPRGWLATLIAPEYDEAVPPIVALLAGRPMNGPPPSPTVCVCHGVSQNAVRAAIERGACNVAAVGEATRAGSGCGSCGPELAALLAAAGREAVAA